MESYDNWVIYYRGTRTRQAMDHIWGYGMHSVLVQGGTYVIIIIMYGTPSYIQHC